MLQLIKKIINKLRKQPTKYCISTDVGSKDKSCVVIATKKNDIITVNKILYSRED